MPGERCHALPLALKAALVNAIFGKKQTDILAFLGEGRELTMPLPLDWAFRSKPAIRQTEPFELPPPIPRLSLDDPSQPVAYHADWGNIVKAMYRFGGRVTYCRNEAREWTATLELPPLWG